MNLDKATGTQERLDNVRQGLDRAARQGEIIELFAHRPGVTVGWDDLEAVVAGAAERGLRFYTYAELQEHPRGPGIALSFDDAAVETWFSAREIFLRHGARATFFVTRYPEWTDDQRALLRQLAAEGHAVEPHGRLHVDSPQYVEDRGVRAFLSEEVLPSIDALIADGYSPTTYAYPFGKRTSETDRAILEYLPQVRSLTYSVSGPLVASPCPR